MSEGGREGGRGGREGGYMERAAALCPQCLGGRG